MADSKSTLLKPLASVDGEPAFDEPWQAEVLAIADTLVQNGMFSASAWSNALGKALNQAQTSGASDAMIGKREDWERAYLSTPHGQPVNLKTDQQA